MCKQLRNIAFGLVFMAGHAGVAQWSRTYGTGLGLNGLVLRADTEIVVAGAWAPYQGPLLMRLDAQGDTLQTTAYPWYWTPGRTSTLVPAPDGGLLLAGSMSNAGNDVTVAHFSPTLDSIRAGYSNDAWSWHAINLTVAPDSTILVFGEAGPAWDLGIQRFSQQLQLLASYRFLSPTNETCGNGITTFEGGFAVAGIRVLSGADWNMHVVKSDAQGNIQWERSIGDDWYELGGFIAQAPDTNYYVAGGYRWPNVLFARSTLVQLNSAGVPLWYCVVPTVGSSWLLTKPVITDDGRVLAAGKSIMNAYYRGQLMCADTSGALLWERTYATDTMANNAFLDMQQDPDGGFVLVGQATDPLTGDDRPWVVRTDSVGCLVPGCDVIDGIQDQRTDLGSALIIAPNPVTDHALVTVRLPSGINYGALQLTLTDGLGRRLHSQYALNQKTVEVRLEHLTDGTYYLHLTNGPHWLSGGKLVKE
ncbi:MAG: hypothetical protein IPJ76_04080 [Flavobacteriales bacterium]|nr:MAG: hypothetical protein IPJ76_04080 [Flavobacteriales bacterium]